MAYSITHDAAFWQARFGPPECVLNYHYYSYEYLDDLGFMRPACELLADWPLAGKLLETVGNKLRSLGWEGDGELQVLWLPHLPGLEPPIISALTFCTLNSRTMASHG